MLQMVEEVEPAIEEALLTTEEAETTAEAPLIDVKAIIPPEGGSLAEGLTEVSSSSWA